MKKYWLTLISIAIVLLLLLSACTDTNVLSDENVQDNSHAENNNNVEAVEPVLPIMTTPIDVSVDDIFEFGTWRGKNIEWQVLEVQTHKALIITRDIISVRQYHGFEKEYGERLSEKGRKWNPDTSVTWADSEIREWLDIDFLNNAFSENEQNAILMSEIDNPKNPYYGTDGGPITEDRIFLLSIPEAEKYFKDEYERFAMFEMKPEDQEYIEIIYEEDMENGKSLFESNDRYSWLKVNQPWQWWLRSPGSHGFKAANVDESGYIAENGISTYSFMYFPVGVRPAMWVQAGVEDVDFLVTEHIDNTNLVFITDDNWDIPEDIHLLRSGSFSYGEYEYFFVFRAGLGQCWGFNGRSIEGSGGIKMRKQPSLNSKVIFVVPEEEQVWSHIEETRLIAGRNNGTLLRYRLPVEADGKIWWQVDYAPQDPNIVQHTGWIAYEDHIEFLG
jgi:hypothetical protein